MQNLNSKIKIINVPVIPAQAGILCNILDLDLSVLQDSRFRGNDKQHFVFQFCVLLFALCL